MSAFAVLRSAANLTDSCASLSEFFTYRRRLYPALESETLLGICISPSLVTNIPQYLDVGEAADALIRIQIHESVSLPALWTLCWLKKPEAEQITRSALLGTLLGLSRSGEQEQDEHGQFIPVFDHWAAPLDVDQGMQDLRTRYSQHLLAPLYQNADTGELIISASCNA